jgi:hypothetical protein
LKFGDNTAGETGPPGIAQMQIGQQRQGATAPVCGQVRQLDRDARRAQPAGVYKAVNAREHGSSKERGGDIWPAQEQFYRQADRQLKETVANTAWASGNRNLSNKYRRFSCRRTPLKKTRLLLLLLLLLGGFLRKPLIINDGAGEGNRTLVSTYPILFLCKPLICEVKACIVRFRELH